MAEQKTIAFQVRLAPELYARLRAAAALRHHSAQSLACELFDGYTRETEKRRGKAFAAAIEQERPAAGFDDSSVGKRKAGSRAKKSASRT